MALGRAVGKDLILPLSPKLEGCLELSERLAIEDRASSIAPAHVVLAIANNENVITVRSLLLLDREPKVLQEIARQQLKFIVPQTQVDVDLGLSEKTRELLFQATKEAVKAESLVVEDYHIILALLNHDSALGKNIASGLSINSSLLLSAVSRLGSIEGKLTNAGSVSSPKVGKELLEHSVDMSELGDGKAQAEIVGRDEEIESLEIALCSSFRISALLVGGPGVGKKSIIRGLARRLARGLGAMRLNKCRILSIDIPSVVAGTSYQGELEQRFTKLLNSAERQSDSIVLFFDDFHTLADIGAHGTWSGLSILKPYLGRQKLRILGTTTDEGFAKSLRSDASLTRHFTVLRVEEPSRPVALRILQGIGHELEKTHDVSYSDEGLERACELSERLMRDRHLPDKAIELIDHAAAMANVLTHRVLQSTEDGKFSDYLSSQSAADQSLLNSWLELFQKDSNPSDESERANLQETLVSEIRSKQVSARIDADFIAVVASRKTGIPVRRLQFKSSERLENLERELAEKLVGQPDAIRAVCRSFQRRLQGMEEENMPFGRFLFLGPSGTGKTYLAQLVARHLFLDDKSLINVNLSEYQSEETINKLIGAPPGYVGFDSGGYLTEAIRKRPYSVVLFDEADKAHDRVLKVLLQILDEGNIVDGRMIRTDFRHCVIILTSNFGAADITNAYHYNRKLSEEEVRTLAIRATRIPELIGRLQESVAYYPFSSESINQIIRLRLNEIMAKFSTRGITATITTGAIEFFSEHGFDPNTGARPLAEILRRNVLDSIIDGIIKHEIKDGQCLVVDSQNGMITVHETGDSNPDLDKGLNTAAATI